MPTPPPYRASEIRSGQVSEHDDPIFSIGGTLGWAVSHLIRNGFDVTHGQFAVGFLNGEREGKGNERERNGFDVAHGQFRVLNGGGGIMSLI